MIHVKAKMKGKKKNLPEMRFAFAQRFSLFSPKRKMELLMMGRMKMEVEVEVEKYLKRRERGWWYIS
jgi:hypothetical protein